MSGFRDTLKTFLYAVKPDKWPGQQDENWRCSYCERGFLLGGTGGRVTRKVKYAFRRPENHRKSCVFIKALTALGEPEVLDNGVAPAESRTELVKVVGFLHGLHEQAQAVAKRERRGMSSLDCRYLDLERLPNVVNAPGDDDFLGPVFSVGDIGMDFHGQYPEFDELSVSIYDLVGGPEGAALRAKEARRKERLQLLQVQWSAKCELARWEKALKETRRDIKSGEIGGKQATRRRDGQVSAVSKGKKTLREAQEALDAFTQAEGLVR